MDIIFENINNWLNFGEAKNALLVGYVLALSSMVDYDKIQELGCFKGIVLLLLALSLIFPLISFFPLYKFFKLNKTGNNLMFYRDISGYTSKAYIKELRKKYYHNENDEDQTNRKIIYDLAEEIVINSRITVYKMTMFRYGLFFAIMLTVSIMLWWML